ncbi:MAG: hypothetical protein ACFE0P_11195 [Oceanicaulis sp.]
MTRLPPAIFAALAAAGCASGGGAVSTKDCPLRPPSNIVFWWDAPALEPGESVTLTPYFTERPGMMEPLPPTCITGASLSPPGLASLGRDRDGAMVVRIADDTAPGRVSLEATYADIGRVRAVIDVFDADAAPLTGVWAQDAAACAAQGAEPVRELIFEGDGEFSVTWTPFETYKDFWGRYTYDPESGALTLEPEGGNHVPSDIVPGVAELSAGGRLRLLTASLGTPRSGLQCTAPFDRIR